jgi:hypothetical protein
MTPDEGFKNWLLASKLLESGNYFRQNSNDVYGGLKIINTKNINTKTRTKKINKKIYKKINKKKIKTRKNIIKKN